jgi:hypothetical protein
MEAATQCNCLPLTMSIVNENQISISLYSAAIEVGASSLDCEIINQVPISFFSHLVAATIAFSFC